MMNNTDVEDLVNSCMDEINRIEGLIQTFGSTNEVSNFLTKYTLMSVCGTLERAYKTIIADYYKSFSRELVRFIDKNVNDATLNATYDNICKVLGLFSEHKLQEFKTRVQNLTNYNRLLASFASLNNLRNNMVHGLTMSASFTDINNRFDDSLIIIQELDAVMH